MTLKSGPEVKPEFCNSWFHGPSKGFSLTSIAQSVFRLRYMTAILTHLDQEHLASGCWTGAKLPFIVPNIAIMWGWVFFFTFFSSIWCNYKLWYCSSTRHIVNFEWGMLGNWRFLKVYNSVCLLRDLFESLEKGVLERKQIVRGFLKAAGLQPPVTINNSHHFAINVLVESLSLWNLHKGTTEFCGLLI